MYKYIDNKYNEAILELKVFHSKRVFRLIGLIIFVLFLFVSIVIFWGKGIIVYLSPLISLFVTSLYMFYAYRDLKKKARRNIIINAIEITFYDKSMYIKSRIKNNINNVDISYSQLLKGYETAKYFFLYENNVSAIAIDKSKINNDNFDTFIKQRVKFR